MSRWVERIEDRLFARFGGAASGSAELGDIAHRVATLMLSVIRYLAVPTGIVLMIEGDAAPGNIALLTVYALAWITLSVRWELRLSPARQPRRVGWTTVGDAAALLLAMSVSGGADSPVRLLLVPLPLVLGLVASARAVVVGSLATAVGYAILGGPAGPAGALAIELAWAGAVGVVIARLRRRSLERLTAVDDLRRSWAAGGRVARPSELGQEVREAALGPLETILARLPGADPRLLDELSSATADVAARLRSIVVELHVLTARQGGLRASLEGLVQRRSPGAATTLETPTSPLDENVSLLVTSLAREALRAVASPATRHVGLRVARTDTSLVVQVRATPAPAEPEAGARAELFVAHATAAGATATHRSGGTARAVVDAEVPERAPSWIPGRSLQEARLLILMVRVPSYLAVLAAGAVAGASDPRFYLVGALILAWSPAVLQAVTSPRASLRDYLLRATPDLFAVVLLAALLGDARAALLPLVVAVPPCYGLLLSVPVTGLIVALFLGGLAAAGFGSTVFVIAFAWSGVIALLLAAATTALDLSLVRQARHRAALVRRLAADAELERRRIAERLHDETLQLLLAARQDLEEAAAGNGSMRASAAQALAAAVATLRRAESELEADADADALPDGPGSALQELADAVGERDGPRVHLELDDRAIGHHDGLVVRLASEFAANVVTHAAADELSIGLSRRGDAVLLVVTDDGRGIDLARVRDAVARGHVGLASCRERVQRTGGTMVVSACPSGGTRVLVTLPARPPDRSTADA